MCFLVFCAVVVVYGWLFMLLLLFITVIKIVKIIFFRIKHRDNLEIRKRGGISVNAFLLFKIVSSLCLVMFLE